YGSLAGIAAREVFMFVLLGEVLKAAGGIDFFMKIAKSAGSRLRSGPAQAAVISSAFMGTVNGNISSNVATTGHITIPLMNKTGYTKSYSGAVEAVASTGVQIMPPVMGVAAFIMANTTGIPYSKIIAIALLPALLYFIYLSISLQIKAVKQDFSLP